MNILGGDVTIDEVEETFDHQAQPDCYISMGEISGWFALRVSE